MTGPKSVKAVFNNPGQLIFQNTNNGQLEIWFMQGTKRLSSVAMSSTTNPGVSWQLSGVADADLNGSKDLFFYNHTSKSVVMWLMNGNIKGGSYLLNHAPPIPYRIGGAADFNGDHLMDQLW